MDVTRPTLLVSCLLFFTGGAAASSLTVEPESLDLDLAAGSDVTRELGVSYSGDTSVVGEVDYSVTAESTDTGGLSVEVSPQRFILDPGDTRTVELGVESNHTLKPDNFTVRLNAVTEVETETVGSSGGDDDDDGDSGGGSFDGIEVGFGGDDSDTGNDGKGGQVGESPNRTGEEQNGSDQSSNRVEELRGRVEELRKSLEEKENRTQRLEKRLNETGGNQTVTPRDNGRASDQRFVDALVSALIQALFPFL